MRMEHCWNVLTGENWSARRKRCSSATLCTKPRNLTRGSAAKCRRNLPRRGSQGGIKESRPSVMWRLSDLDNQVSDQPSCFSVVFWRNEVLHVSKQDSVLVETNNSSALCSSTLKAWRSILNRTVLYLITPHYKVELNIKIVILQLSVKPNYHGTSGCY